MISKMLLGAALVASSLAPAQAAKTEMQMLANPIRKVVTMLQNMQKKVTDEGEKADEVFDKFVCYCKTGGVDLTAAIEAGLARIQETEPEIIGETNQKAQLEKDVESHRAEQAAAKKAIAEGTAIREKEKAAFDKALADSNANLQAMEKAAKAIFNGVKGGFLQTPEANMLRTLLTKSQASLDANRRDVLSFLSGETEGPGSEQVLGVLAEMEKDMKEEQKEMVDTEQAAVETFNQLIGAKTRTDEALTKAIQQKMGRMGSLGIEIAEEKNLVEDTEDAVAEDKEFASDLERNCHKRVDVHMDEKKMRGQEIVALGETIKMLNDDDALDLFKKTLPGTDSSFLQLQTTATTMRAQARRVLAQFRAKAQPGSNGAVQLNFITLALSGRKVGLEAIMKLVDKLIATTKAEQVADDDKKEYCAAELDSAEDKKKSLQRSVSDFETSIEETKEGISTLKDEIHELTNGIIALDASVAEATAQRKVESSEYQQLMAGNGAAKKLLLFAKERLSKFYHASLLQVDSQSQDSPPAPPEAAEAYKKKDGGAVVNMITVLIGDLDKDMTAAKTEERISQEDYEQTMKDSAEKRAQDSKSLSDRESAKADAETELEEAHAEKKATTKELMVAESYSLSIHGECDWLVKYFDVRKEARDDEIDGLQKIKAILSGADLSFVQIGSSQARARKFLRLRSV